MNFNYTSPIDLGINKISCDEKSINKVSFQSIFGWQESDFDSLFVLSMKLFSCLQSENYTYAIDLTLSVILFDENLSEYYHYNRSWVGMSQRSILYAYEF